jgi:hypothetical protein
MRTDRRLVYIGTTIAVLLGILVLAVPLTLPSALHARLVAAVAERFDGSVDSGALRVSFFPRLRIAGDAVVVRHKGRRDVPALITIKSFSADASLFGIWGRPLRLQRVHLVGLEINVPPGGLDVDGDKDDGDKDEEPEGDGTGEPAESPLVVEDLLSEAAVLRILRRTPGKRPREFTIGRLSMRDTGANVPWAFTAALTNPTPPGQIKVDGTFGPWNAAQPARTALAADYEFSNANLGDFDGIRGTLHSTGAFAGVLERIEVEGQTEIPDFALADVGHSVDLRARFRSVVDATNGNTLLEPVDATFGRTVVHATGGVVEREAEDGRTVSLKVAIDKGRIEDVLRLAAKSKQPPMVGALKLRVSLELPPGHIDPVEKLRLLDGSFEIDSARFVGGGLQARLNELSQKAQGEKDQPVEHVVSDFTGRFTMSRGAIRFSTITFKMPGAQVDLNGVYAVASEALDFRGTVRLDAKLSQLTTGPKAFLLKLVEPLFRRGRVTVVPIVISGTVEQPKFGLDIGRALTSK